MTSIPHPSANDNGSPVGAVLDRLKGVHKSGNQWMANCPAHDDGTASLSVGVGKDGKVVLKCFAGCDFKAVVNALGLAEKDLFPSTGGNGRRIEKVYDYHDEAGCRVHQTVRFEGKKFSQRRPRV